MQPAVVAKALMKVETEWGAQAAAFYDCNATVVEGEDCNAPAEAFQKSCMTVVSAVVEGSSGDRGIVGEYMGDICGQPALQGWKQERCQSIAEELAGAMTEDAAENRDHFDGANLCLGFWQRVLREEARKKSEQAAKAEEARAKAEQGAKTEEASEKAEEAAKAEKVTATVDTKDTVKNDAEAMTIDGTKASASNANATATDDTKAIATDNANATAAGDAKAVAADNATATAIDDTKVTATNTTNGAAATEDAKEGPESAKVTATDIAQAPIVRH